MAIQCPRCRLDNPEGTLYCEKCGEELSPPEEIHPSRAETYIHPKQDLTTGSSFAGVAKSSKSRAKEAWGSNKGE